MSLLVNKVKTGTIVKEADGLLKSQLGIFLDLTCDLMEYTPGGEMYSSTIPEIKKAIDQTIEKGLNYNGRTA